MDIPAAKYRNFQVAMNPMNDENPIVMDVDGTGARSGSSEWMVIATVLDRFFLCLSVVVAVLVTIGMASHT